MPAFVSSARGMEPTMYWRDSVSSRAVTPSALIRFSSSSIDAMARSTFPGATPARIINGPSIRLGSKALET